jgi:hypothetical protein
VLSLKQNNFCNREAGKALSEMLVVNTVLTELDVSESTYYKCDSAGFAQELAVGIIDNGSILTVNLLKNDIGIEQAKALASILKEHPTLKSLCGNSGEETELDMSGKQIGADGAIMLAPEIASNGEAMTSLNLADNGIGGYYVHKGTASEKFQPAPEGVCTPTVAFGPFLIPLSTLRRPSCYR